MDFKIGEDIEEENKESEVKKDNSKLKIIIIVVFAIIVFLVVFLALNSVLNPKTKAKPTNTQVVTSEKKPLTERNVKILYNYVTYNANGGVRYDIFVKNKKVTIDTFTEEEKYYYALQYAQVEDFEYTGNKDENGNGVFLWKRS